VHSLGAFVRGSNHDANADHPLLEGAACCSHSFSGLVHTPFKRTPSAMT